MAEKKWTAAEEALGRALYHHAPFKSGEWDEAFAAITNIVTHLADEGFEIRQVVKDEPVGLASALSARREEIARSLVANTEPVASELDIELAGQLKGREPPAFDAPSPPPTSGFWFKAPPLESGPASSWHTRGRGAPPVIPPAGVYGNKVLPDGDPKASKVAVFYSKIGGTWMAAEGSQQFERTKMDENWTFQGWLELRSTP